MEDVVGIDKIRARHSLEPRQGISRERLSLWRGQKPAPTVTVAVVILVSHARVLVGQRSGGSIDGCWEFPGGKVDRGESPEDAARRELEEEVGVIARRLVSFDRTVHRYPDREVDIHFFVCREFDGKPDSSEHAELRWVTPKELAELETPPRERGRRANAG